MDHKTCPFCDKIIVPYPLIIDKEITEDIDLNIMDAERGKKRIMRKGTVKIDVLGCPKCKKVFIEVK